MDEKINYQNRKNAKNPAKYPPCTVLMQNSIFTLAEPGSAWLIPKICWNYGIKSVAAYQINPQRAYHNLVNPLKLLDKLSMELIYGQYSP